MNTTQQRIAAAALTVLVSGGLAACGSVEPGSPRQDIGGPVFEAPAQVPQSESGFGPRRDIYGESGFGPRRDVYGESGFGPRR